MQYLLLDPLHHDESLQCVALELEFVPALEVPQLYDDPAVRHFCSTLRHQAGGSCEKVSNQNKNPKACPIPF